MNRASSSASTGGCSGGWCSPPGGRLRRQRGQPGAIRAYRRLVGRVAKTDRIDARLIDEYGATMQPAASVPLSEAQQGTRELTSRRDQLIEAIVAEKKRLAGSATRTMRRAWRRTLPTWLTKSSA